MKRYLIIFILWFAVPRLVWADAATKLSRGVNNVALSWFEVINEMGNEADRHGLWIGFPSGILRGAVFGIVRAGAGVYEIITFPFPNGKRGYQPVVLPETAWTRR